jgi:TetR/AcrR family transcriptional regulator, fatty acid biosynthesis regulator
MSIRQEQKLKTRQAIIDAALELSKDKGFPALSLREVTRQAGIAPATFYRHFVDMEDLGLALVDQVGLILRQLMRHRVKVKGSVINTSVETFMEFVESYPNLIRLLKTDIVSGPRPFRLAIQRETRRFAEELEDDFKRDQALNLRPPLAHLNEVAEMMVLLVFNQGVEALEMNAAERKLLSEKIVRELRLIIAGSRVLAAAEAAK